MAAFRTNAFNSWSNLRSEMDRVLSDLVQTFPATNWTGFSGGGERSYPAVNLWDAGSELQAEAELPGVKAEDLEVFVVGNELTIRGQRHDADMQGSAYHRRERNSGKFSRALRLPVDVDPDRVQATLTDGVLKVVLPKAEAAKPRKINITSN